MQVLSFAPKGGGMLLEKGDKRIHKAATEDDERKASYEAQVRKM